MQRRARIDAVGWVGRAVFAAILWLAVCPAFAAALEIKGFVLTVSDLDRSVRFYEKALNFNKVSERVLADRDYDYLTGVYGSRLRVATLQLGNESIELQEYLPPGGNPIPVDSRANGAWFQHFAVVVSDMERAYEHLQRIPFQAISGAPQTIPASNSAAAGVKAFKFKDPDGHPLELLYLPADKGRAKWHRHDGRLFLGVDHSAITVTSTEKSAAFYRDLLGLSIAGGSLNSGSTQEQLDNAFGGSGPGYRSTARARAGAGPGVSRICDAFRWSPGAGRLTSQRPLSHARGD
jgi:catechol 2,3-dioxygenase-like lactoylglutathione lyase family enzyme